MPKKIKSGVIDALEKLRDGVKEYKYYLGDKEILIDYAIVCSKHTGEIPYPLYEHLINLQCFCYGHDNNNMDNFRYNLESMVIKPDDSKMIDAVVTCLDNAPVPGKEYPSIVSLAPLLWGEVRKVIQGISSFQTSNLLSVWNSDLFTHLFKPIICRNDKELYDYMYEKHSRYWDNTQPEKVELPLLDEPAMYYLTWLADLYTSGISDKDKPIVAQAVFNVFNKVPVVTLKELESKFGAYIAFDDNDDELSFEGINKRYNILIA